MSNVLKLGVGWVQLKKQVKLQKKAGKIQK